LQKNEHKVVSTALLAWYDVHARELPWRVSPSDRKAGVVPDPYRVWLSEIMLQQTTVAAVKDYFHRFTSRWPTVQDLAAARDEDVMGEWAGLGYYARARNLLKCARQVTQAHGGIFPDTHDGLLTLPGVGLYTAAAIASIAFDRSETVLDGNVERVMARFHDIHDPLPGSKPRLRDLAEEHTPLARPGDHAQAVMDLGATVCTPKSPACGICPLMPDCQGRLAGTAAELPKKTPKKPKPTRYGYAYVARDAGGGWLMERRPDKGLLGGMLGWPGSDWSEKPSPNPPFEADWHDIGAEVRHTFTHFHLHLRVLTAPMSDIAAPAGLHIVAKHDFRPSDLPTVMRKAYDLWRDH
jgi:A/G-specific adenine glycosylase